MAVPKDIQQATIPVGTSSVQVLPASTSSQRTFVLIQNIGSNPIYLSFQGAAVLNQGIGHLTQGSNIQLDDNVIIPTQKSRRSQIRPARRSWF